MIALPKQMIIGSDHAGFSLKTRVIQHLEQLSIVVQDVGTCTDESVDYPDFAHPVAKAVAAGEYPLGIVICGSGQGAAITANKHQEIRCALCWSPEIASLSRQHNNANVLALPARFISEDQAIIIVDAFLNSIFEGGRHTRRVQKIALKNK